MSRRQISDTSASVNRRLLNHAREHHEGFQLVLTQYALERLLYRMSRSSYNDQFILKGAMLFSVWTSQPHRATRDLDLLGQGPEDIPRLEQIFRDICAVPVEDDGLRFAPETVIGEAIREAQEYGGVRIDLIAYLGKAKAPVQIDVGFGDTVTPAPDDIVYPVILEFPAAQLRAYPQVSFIAEKFQAIVHLGMTNSRMKDFYDLWVLSQNFEFDGTILSRAISETFARRQTRLPQKAPLSLSTEFYQDMGKQTQWNAFLNKGRLPAGNPSLDEVISALRGFLMPPTMAAAEGMDFNSIWHPSGPWKSCN